MTQSWHVLPQVMDALFQANDALHAAVGSQIGDLDPARYVRDFRTIRLDYGQRTGKTTYMVQTAQPDDLIITITDEMAQYLTRQGARCRVAYVKEFMHVSEAVEKRHPRVWIDDSYSTLAALSNWISTLQLYRHLVHDIDQQFVILG